MNDDTICINITGKIASGRTLVAAVIARALAEAFPDKGVEVQNLDGDFDHRMDQINNATDPQDRIYSVKAEKMVILDMCSPNPGVKNVDRFMGHNYVIQRPLADRNLENEEQLEQLGNEAVAEQESQA